MKKENSNFKTTKSERLNYSVYFLGQGICYCIVFMFLQTFALDIGIPALTFAGIALVIKVWDSINDPIFGYLVEKVKFKGGKFLPWIKLSVIVIPLTSILVFAIPTNLSLTAKIVWCVVAYVLWDVAYTIGDVPIYALSTSMSDDPQERVTLISGGRVFAILALLFGAVIIPLVRIPLGGWFMTAVVLCVFSALVMLPISLKGKERFSPVKNENDKDPSIKEMMLYVVKNKYMLWFYIGVITYSTFQVGMTLGMILARHTFGNESVSSIISLVSMTPWVICALLIPSIVKKVDKMNLFIFSIIAGIVLNTLIFFIGYENLTVFYVLLFLKGLLGGFSTTLTYTFIGDCCEYSTYKMGVDAKGIGFAAHTFFTKFMAATQTALSSLCLAIIGYVSTEGAVQPASIGSNLWFLYTIVPAIGAVLSLFMFLQYKLRDKDVYIMTQCNQGKMSRDDAEKMLSRKYN